MDHSQENRLKIITENQNPYDFHMCVFRNHLWQILRNRRDVTCRFDHPHYCHSVLYDQDRGKI